jgi:hypothetical protein
MLLVFPTVRDGDVTGYFFLGAGSILLINALRYFWFYRKRAAKFRQEYKEMIDIRERIRMSRPGSLRMTILGTRTCILSPGSGGRHLRDIK